MGKLYELIVRLFSIKECAESGNEFLHACGCVRVVFKCDMCFEEFSKVPFIARHNPPS